MRRNRNFRLSVISGIRSHRTTLFNSHVLFVLVVVDNKGISKSYKPLNEFIFDPLRLPWHNASDLNEVDFETKYLLMDFARFTNDKQFETFSVTRWCTYSIQSIDCTFFFVSFVRLLSVIRLDPHDITEPKKKGNGFEKNKRTRK